MITLSIYLINIAFEKNAVFINIYLLIKESPSEEAAETVFLGLFCLFLSPGLIKF